MCRTPKVEHSFLDLLSDPFRSVSLYHCTACDKFVVEGEFEGATKGLDAGPGKQVCAGCEEYGDMFG